MYIYTQHVVSSHCHLSVLGYFYENHISSSDHINDILRFTPSPSEHRISIETYLLSLIFITSGTISTGNK